MKKIWEYLKKINKYEIIGICVWVFVLILISHFFGKDNFKFIIKIYCILGFPLSFFSIVILFFLGFASDSMNFSEIIGKMIIIIIFFPIIINGYLLGKIFKKILNKIGEKK
jgi:hypothetical protein